MRKNLAQTETTGEQLREEDIRDYAYHLYEQSGSIPGRDLENWLEAKACLESAIPRDRSRSRLHHHRLHYVQAFTIPSPEAKNLAS